MNAVADVCSISTTIGATSTAHSRPGISNPLILHGSIPGPGDMPRPQRHASAAAAGPENDASRLRTLYETVVSSLRQKSPLRLEIPAPTSRRGQPDQ